MSKTSGTIGILTSEQGRFTRFWSAFNGLRLPGQTEVAIKIGVDIARLRNQVLAEARGDWVWFIDDDHTFGPDLLNNLLARNVDVVQPLVLKRYAPFGPVMMGPKREEDEAHWQYALTTRETGGLKKVHIVGAAGMLIRRPVWEAIPQPWFEAGLLEKDALSEDMSFCRKVNAAGFQVWCDLDNHMGHLNVGEVWPKRNPGKEWTTLLKFGGQVFEFPTAQPKFTVDQSGKLVETLED